MSPVIEQIYTLDTVLSGKFISEWLTTSDKDLSVTFSSRFSTFKNLSTKSQCILYNYTHKKITEDIPGNKYKNKFLS